ncbi:MAG: triose-phosphate isomerase [Brumimicrobium sp.]
MRKNIVAGNWKMNLSWSEANSLSEELEKSLSDKKVNCEVYNFVPAIYLKSLIDSASNITIGAQNGYPKDAGAYTGEISMKQLKNIGTKAILIGHSERRQLFSESDVFLREKVDEATRQDLKIFFCCGETLAQRESGNFEGVVIQQLENSLFHLSENDFKKVVIAYEPIWAIGTGKTATPEQANEMHKNIRQAIVEKYNQEIAEDTTILYGGSCNPTNAKDLFSKSDIDGGLIGGASLKAEDFISIINTF